MLNQKIRLDCLDPTRHESIETEVDQHVDALRKAINHLLDAGPSSFDEAWQPVQDASVSLGNLWADISHMAAVRDSSQLRALVGRLQPKLIEADFLISRNQNLYELLRTFSSAQGVEALSVNDRAALSRLLRDFELSGIHLPPEDQNRLKTLKLEAAELGRAYSSAILDAKQAWSLLINDESQLAGIPQNDRSMLAAAAKATGQSGWLLTLNPACIAAVMMHCENRELRRQVYEASGTVASDQGPHAGQFDNGPRMEKIMEVRREAARIHGFDNAAAWLMRTRMATSAAEVRAFLSQLAHQVRPAAISQLDQISSFAQQHLGIDDVAPWDLAYASENLKRTMLKVSESEIRAYFPIRGVLQGWKWLLHSLFGIHLNERTDVQAWDESIQHFEVVDDTGKVFASLFMDLHARQGKRGGAWMSQARPKTGGAEASTPVAFLTCNFPPVDESGNAYLSHSQIMTLLHETGHCLNLLFTEVERPNVGGISGIEWDAIEIPSQMMEDFAWAPVVLEKMSTHRDTGASLPTELFHRMLAARHFGRGINLLGQIEAASFDLDLHEAPAEKDVMTILDESRRQTAIFETPHWLRFPHSFQHIFGGAYASGYYSYLWAEWFSADGFALFSEHGVISRACGQRLRDEILSRGSVRTASANYKAFRGHMPSTDALLIRHGLLTAPSGETA